MARQPHTSARPGASGDDLTRACAIAVRVLFGYWYPGETGGPDHITAAHRLSASQVHRMAFAFLHSLPAPRKEWGLFTQPCSSARFCRVRRRRGRRPRPPSSRRSTLSHAQVRARGQTPRSEIRLRQQIIKLKGLGAKDATELAQLRTDREHLVRVVDQLTAHNRQLLRALSQPDPPVRVLPTQPHPNRSH